MNIVFDASADSYATIAFPVAKDELASLSLPLDSGAVVVEGAKAARIEISTIKFYVAGILQNVLDKAIQVHGAYGLTDDIVISHWYRLERAARIYDGPDEVHKSSLAKQILNTF